jgi:flagellar biosynthetic protein FliQ
MDSVEAAAALAQGAAFLALKLALPVLLVGLVVGLFVSLCQTLTQVQEQSLSLVPKLAAMVVSLLVLTPWLLSTAAEYMRQALAGELFR